MRPHPKKKYNKVKEGENLQRIDKTKKMKEKIYKG